MKLYNSLGPNPHIVRMFAAEKGIALALEAVDVTGSEHRRPPYSTMNVMMQTPALQTDSGQVICEVTAICEYLEEKHPEPALIGRTAAERAETRMWCRRIDLNILEARARVSRATTARDFYQDKIKLLSPAAAEELKLLVDDRIHWLDQRMQGKRYLCGDRFTLADLLLFCTMYFRAPVGRSNLPAGCSNLPAWFERIRERPSVAA